MKKKCCTRVHWSVAEAIGVYTACMMRAIAKARIGTVWAYGRNQFDDVHVEILPEHRQREVYTWALVDAAWNRMCELVPSDIQRLLERELHIAKIEAAAKEMQALKEAEEHHLDMEVTG